MVKMNYLSICFSAALLAPALHGQAWLTEKKSSILRNLERMPLTIALVDMGKGGNVPRILPPPSQAAASTILRFTGGVSENMDLKLNRKFFRSEDPVPYLTSLVDAHVFAMADSGRGTQFYLRSRGCLTERKSLAAISFADMRANANRFLQGMRQLLGYDGIVVEHQSGGQFIIGAVDGTRFHTGLQGSALQDSAAEMVVKKGEFQAQALFTVIEEKNGFALARSLVGTKLPRIGTKVIIEEATASRLAH